MSDVFRVDIFEDDAYDKFRHAVSGDVPDAEAFILDGSPARPKTRKVSRTPPGARGEDRAPAPEKDGALQDFEDTRVSGSRAKALLREIGIEDEVRRCVEDIRMAEDPGEVATCGKKLEAYLKAVMIYKSAADTANRNSVMAAQDGTAFDEIKITMKR